MTRRNALMNPEWFTPPARPWDRRRFMKSPSPPQPDPAVGEAARSNAEVARESLAFTREQWEEGRSRREWEDATMRQLTEYGLERMVRQDKISDDYYNYLTSTFRPLETGIVADAEAYDTPQRREEEAGRAAGNVRTQFGVQREQATREAARYGTDPTRANARFGVGMDAAEAAAAAEASNTARRNVEAVGWARKMDAASLGRGLPSAQATSAQVATGAGGAAGNAAMAPGAGARADFNSAMGGYGTAIQGFGSSGNIALGGYNAALRGWGAEVDQQNSLWSGVGALAGMAAGSFLGPFGAAAGAAAGEKAFGVQGVRR